MTETEIKEKIFSILKKIAPDTNPYALLPDELIRETLAIDSFDYLNFIIAIDEAFGIETPEQDYNKINTIEKLIIYINEKIGLLKN